MAWHGMAGQAWPGQARAGQGRAGQGRAHGAVASDAFTCAASASPAVTPPPPRYTSTDWMSKIRPVTTNQHDNGQMSTTNKTTLKMKRNNQ